MYIKQREERDQNKGKPKAFLTTKTEGTHKAYGSFVLDTSTMVGP